MRWLGKVICLFVYCVECKLDIVVKMNRINNDFLHHWKWKVKSSVVPDVRLHQGCRFFRKTTHVCLFLSRQWSMDDSKLQFFFFPTWQARTVIKYVVFSVILGENSCLPPTFDIWGNHKNFALCPWQKCYALYCQGSAILYLYVSLFNIFNNYNAFLSEIDKTNPIFTF